MHIEGPAATKALLYLAMSSLYFLRLKVKSGTASRALPVLPTVPLANLPPLAITILTHLSISGLSLDSCILRAAIAFLTAGSLLVAFKDFSWASAAA